MSALSWNDCTLEMTNNLMLGYTSMTAYKNMSESTIFSFLKIHCGGTMSLTCVMYRSFVESLFLDHHFTLMDHLFWEQPIYIYAYLLGYQSVAMLTATHHLLWTRQWPMRLICAWNVQWHLGHVCSCSQREYAMLHAYLPTYIIPNRLPTLHHFRRSGDSDLASSNPGQVKRMTLKLIIVTS